SLSDYRAIHLTTGSSLISSKTNGFIKIYQSRMNIDLFVFFSVFFSSFFLFLSIGICFWKVKFAYEIHRRRRTLKHEYHKRMARPFAKIQLFIKPSTVISDDEENSQQLTFPIASSSVDIPLLLPSTRTDIDYSSHVVSVEPLRDQNTCYTTLLFHLPGDLSTQYRLCAGTTLAQLPTDYANALSDARIEAELQKRNKRRKKCNGRNEKTCSFVFLIKIGILYSDPSDIIILRNLSSRHRLTLLISPTDIDFTQDNLHCLLVDQPISRIRLSDLIDPQSQSISFSLSDYRAIHLTTGSSLISSKTNGFIKIYQSRMNIDLFVFFSV
ncbi:unnamed protein product, partial [Rotaria sp. Silwood1]